jgi:predicted MFS family arabinose efflux permease
VVQAFGARIAMWLGLSVAMLSLPLMLAHTLPLVLAGMALAAAGTFFAQATATAFVSRAAAGDKGAASGLYLASYFLGGLVGSAVLGQLFDRFGWAACLGGVGVGLTLAAGFAARLCAPQASR